MNSFIETILNFATSGALGVILIVCVLVASVVIGLFRKTFMQIWDFIVFVVLFIVAYFALMKPFGNWICDKFILQFGLNTTVIVNNIDVYQIDTFTDLIKFLGILSGDAKCTSEYVYSLSHSITYSMALAALGLADIILAPILSLITWPLIKLAIPKKWDHADKRFVGPIVSLLEAFFGITLIINCFSTYSEGMSWIIHNPYVLDKMNVDTKIFDAMKFFTVDFFGALKVLNLHLFNFKFSVGETTYVASNEFASLAKTVFPENSQEIADELSAIYKLRLLEHWMNEFGVVVPEVPII